MRAIFLFVSFHLVVNLVLSLPGDAWCGSDQIRTGKIVSFGSDTVEIGQNDRTQVYPVFPGMRIVRQDEIFSKNLRAGDTVLVQGRNMADGSVMAIEVIQLNDAGNMGFARMGNGEFARVLAKVASVSPLAFTDPYGSETLTVRTNTRTRFLREIEESLADLKVGDEIRVLGRKIVKLAFKKQMSMKRLAMRIPEPPLTGVSYFDSDLVKEKETSPFGFFDPNMLRFHHSLVYGEFARTMNDLGAYWAAYGATFSFNWNLIQKTPGKEIYAWDRLDRMVRISQNHNIHLIGYIKASEPDESHEAGKPKIPALPKNLDGYQRFVSAVVERYDGDGIRDMPGLKVPIKYWSIEDEPLAPIYFKGTGADYARLLLAGAEAVKMADPQGKVIVSMLRNTGWLKKAGDPRKFMLSFYDELAKWTSRTPYDVLDQHWLGAAEDVSSADQFAIYERWIEDVESTARQHGFQKVPLVNLELAGRDTSEVVHARDLVKRHVFLLSLGTGRILWSGLKAAPEYELTRKQADNYFRKVTLIDGDGRKKAAYDTYKLMVDTLDGSDWGRTRTLKKNDKGLFVFQFTKNQHPVWVLWNENGKTKEKLSVPSGVKHVAIVSAVPDSNRDGVDFKQRFHRTTAKVSWWGETVSVDVGKTPVYVMPTTL